MKAHEPGVLRFRLSNLAGRKRLCAVPVAIAVAAVLLTAGLPADGEEPCNPVIDGTYCASQPLRPKTSESSTRLRPIQGTKGGFALTRDQPATLGAITFQGSSRCFALLRRSVCN
jgi:hypothetical protein